MTQPGAARLLSVSFVIGTLVMAIVFVGIFRTAFEELGDRVPLTTPTAAP